MTGRWWLLIGGALASFAVGVVAGAAGSLTGAYAADAAGAALLAGSFFARRQR